MITCEKQALGLARLTPHPGPGTHCPHTRYVHRIRTKYLVGVRMSSTGEAMPGLERQRLLDHVAQDGFALALIAAIFSSLGSAVRLTDAKRSPRICGTGVVRSFSVMSAATRCRHWKISSSPRSECWLLYCTNAFMYVQSQLQSTKCTQSTTALGA